MSDQDSLGADLTADPPSADLPEGDAPYGDLPGAVPSEPPIAGGLARSRGAMRALAAVTLVARAQDGDVAAFERLARSYEAELVRLGYRMLSDLGEAQDATQDTLLTAWKKLPGLQDPAAFHAWVYQLMTRRCLNLLRRRARRRTMVTSDAGLERAHGATAGADTGAEPDQQAQTRAMREGLTVALTTLPAEQRACWVLHAMHHLSYQEIAYAIGVPVSTVRGRIARARVQLAKGMSAWQ